jgi:hypothetical protein
MPKQKRKRPNSSNSPSSIKGKLVERIIASIHEGDNAQVERNVFFPAVDSVSRKREIDVIITYQGEDSQKNQLFVECKNYAETIDVPLIDAFFGKLHDIGVATEKGIFVSVKGFTEGALERAQKAGIRTLFLTGLTENRLAVKEEEAKQYVIFLMATVTQITVKYVHNVPIDTMETIFLFDGEERLRCSCYDLFWKKWCEGVPPSTIGLHKVVIDLPDNYYTPVSGYLEPVASLKGIIQVDGLVMEIAGQAEQHMLVNQAAKSLDKLHAHATFVPPKGKQELALVQSEEELNNYIEQQGGTIKLAVGRHRLPRIKACSLYWPLSERVGKTLSTAINEHIHISDEPFNLESFGFLEGTDIRTAWEPKWDQNPILRELINPL